MFLILEMNRSINIGNFCINFPPFFKYSDTDFHIDVAVGQSRHLLLPAKITSKKGFY